MTEKNIPHPLDNKYCPSKIISAFCNASSTTFFQDNLKQLLLILKSRKISVAVHNRAKYIDLALNGFSINDIATNMGVCPRTATTWIGRFLDLGVEGLYDKPRSGRPLSFTPDKEAIVDSLLIFEPKALAQLPEFSNLHDLLHDQTEWTADLIAKFLEASKSTATKYLSKIKKLNGGSLSYCHSNDPNLPLKSILIDLLYREGNNLGYDVYCFDEKPCIQAIYREFSLEASGRFNRSDRYERRGITNVLGLLEFATGKLELMTSDVKNTESIVDFLKGYFSQPERQGRKSIIIMDNISNHGCVQEILENELPVKVCYTGTNSSWQNLIEAYFSKFQKQYIDNKSFANVEALNASVHAFQHNHNAKIDSSGNSGSPNWKADVPLIMRNRIKLALYHAWYLPKHFSILADGFSIGLASHVENAVGSMARELHYSSNILHGIVANPTFFTDDLVRLAGQLLDNPPTTTEDIPVFTHALASKREQCLKAAFNSLNLDFSFKVYEAYQCRDKAAALVQELMSLFNRPSRAEACRQPKLNNVERAKVALDNNLSILHFLHKEFDEALLKDDASLKQIEKRIAKQQKVVAAFQKKHSQLEQDWELAVNTATPHLQGLKKSLIQRLLESLKCCQRPLSWFCHTETA